MIRYDYLRNWYILPDDNGVILGEDMPEELRP